MWNGMKYGFGFAVGSVLGIAVLKIALDYTSKRLDTVITKLQEKADELDAKTQKEEE